MVDMNAFFEADVLADMVGQAIEKGATNASAVTGEERKITGSEKLQPPAGTFDCFVIEETITSKAMMQKDVEKNISWYAYGIELVKEETYDKKGRLVSTTLLNRINWQLK